MGKTGRDAYEKGTFCLAVSEMISFSMTCYLQEHGTAIRNIVWLFS